TCAGPCTQGSLAVFGRNRQALSNQSSTTTASAAESDAACHSTARSVQVSRPPSSCHRARGPTAGRYGGEAEHAQRTRKNAELRRKAGMRVGTGLVALHTRVSRTIRRQFMNRKFLAVIIGVCFIIGLAGCAGMSPTSKGALGGAATGAGVGALVGDT